MDPLAWYEQQRTAAALHNTYDLPSRTNPNAERRGSKQLRRVNVLLAFHSIIYAETART